MRAVNNDEIDSWKLRNAALNDNICCKSEFIFISQKCSSSTLAKKLSRLKFEIAKKRGKTESEKFHGQ